MSQDSTSFGNGYNLSLARQTSMGSLIMWNISKALQINPHINLQSAIQETQKLLLNAASDTNMMTSQKPEDQYLSCAILAWQQLGHSGTDKLYQFIQSKQEESKKTQNKVEDKSSNNKKPQLRPGSFISYDPTIGSTSYDTVGPVVKLPVDTTRIVMRQEKSACPRKSQKNSNKDLLDKIGEVCCMDSGCIEKLTKLDKATSDLRTRAQRLARSEAKRVELLERAEAAWRDLEIGYQRRLTAAQEKEEDITKQINKLVEERNGYKNACSILAKQLREKSETTENERTKLINMDKEICNNACVRLRLSEDVARLDAEQAELQCKNAQLDRQNQLKEEQIRAKLLNMENEIDCARVLSCETERTMHAELSALRDQITAFSDQLLEEDSLNSALKEELESLLQEKNEIAEDIDACQSLCNNRMQGTVDELNAKRKKLKELKDKVTECQCKLPVDVTVEVKRTPSLAAMCFCKPEDRFSETCSCTSLRTTLLTNLLSDLFGGLQSEMSGGGSEMPCQLLKCLEDKHNWDRCSQIKTNLRNYFSKLLVGELNIAIATSIEKYHARWVGTSCVDAARPTSAVCSADWHDRAVERRAQKLACKLAEDLLQQRADQLTERAKDVLRTGPPPCECMPRSAAVYPVLVKPPGLGILTKPSAEHNETTPVYWQQTNQDVSQLRTQLEDLKKESIKKEDLRIMEDNIVKLVQQSVTEKQTEIIKTPKEANKKIGRIMTPVHRSINTEKFSKPSPSNKLIIKKRPFDNHSPKKGNKSMILGLQMEKQNKPLKSIEQSYAVNMCLCESDKGTNKKEKQELLPLLQSTEEKPFIFQNDTIPPISRVNQIKPIETDYPTDKMDNRKRNKSTRLRCRSAIACFHKPPSNTSIEKLLDKLAKWKCDILNSSNKDIQANEIFNTDTRDKDELYVESPTMLRDNKKNKCVMKSQDVFAKISIEGTNYVSKQTTVDITKSIEKPCDLPFTTDSEYMGAINLEKSNENYCKCVTAVEFEKGQEDSTCPYKLNYEKCDCKIGLKTKKLTSPSKNSNNKITVLNEPENHDDGLNFDSQTKQLSGGDTDPNDKMTISSSLTGCQYCIKFLGVTLTNANSKKNTIDNEQNILNLQQLTKKNNINKNLDTSYDNNENTYIKSHGDVKNESNNLRITKKNRGQCDCSAKYNEFKKLLNSVFSKQYDVFPKNEDKALDTQSLVYTINPESCVCCNAMKSDESNDLEVNAFCLLEQHLKDKLEEFKNTTCKYSCISSDEEKKIFSNILERVKQIILDGTSNVVCKCNNEESSEDSWHRAYVLLQEYLKIKVKRVQCSCRQADENKVIILPEIMDNICNLIDDDFQRLKEICKCNNSKSMKIPNSTNMISGIQLPEKDNEHENTQNRNKVVETSDTQNRNKNVENSNTQNRNKDLETSNMSSQVSYNFGTDTRSCDVMERDMKSCSVNCSFHKYCYHTDEEKCYRATFKNIQKSVDFTKPEMTVSQGYNLCNDNFNTTLTSSLHTENQAQNGNEYVSALKFPYVGYTVECTCNGALGFCTCTKSIVTRNSSNINNIWSTLTNSELQRSNVSYIMDSVLKGPTKAENNIKNVEVENANSDKFMRNTYISVHDEEDFILKDSRLNLCKTYIPATTSADNFNITIDEQWCSNSKLRKAVDFNASTRESVLYYPINKMKNHGQSEIFAQSQFPLNVTGSLSSNCDCNMVPLCHVKLLVKSIEKKLFHSKCTCDSLCPKVCPVHSKINEV